MWAAPASVVCGQHGLMTNRHVVHLIVMLTSGTKAKFPTAFRTFARKPKQPINTHNTHNQEIQMKTTVGDQFTLNGIARMATKGRWGGGEKEALTLWIRLKIGPTTLERDLIISSPVGEYIHYNPVIQHAPKKPLHTYTRKMSQDVHLSTICNCRNVATT